MKHTILVLAILIGALVKAQYRNSGNGGFREKVYPLNHPIENVNEYSYFKDLNNELNIFFG